ncbi:hypothetical protein TSOC_002109 [Tetrabaena socialis]|uniref:Uncharacterized protein n=1 Tax=Tetrabaena socialis TaxID=47790 RepID=A0A2J8AF02_9CHLO|nr:hypothetical protein TSOC_002109 [Tetrabaena socialis]|eukprot:PNH11094.1 hypothetical protein TSOC_002109 [Tetrabaena socialis]
MPRIRKPRYGGSASKLAACYEILLSGAAGECLEGELGCCSDSCCSSAAVSRALSEYCQHSDAAREAFAASNGLGAIVALPPLLSANLHLRAAAARLVAAAVTEGLLAGGAAGAGAQLAAALGLRLGPGIGRDVAVVHRGPQQEEVGGGEASELAPERLGAGAAGGAAGSGALEAVAGAGAVSSSSGAGMVADKGAAAGSATPPAQLLMESAAGAACGGGGDGGSGAAPGAVLPPLRGASDAAQAVVGACSPAAGCAAGGDVGGVRALALCELVAALLTSAAGCEVLHAMHAPEHVLRLCAAAHLRPPTGRHHDELGCVEREALLDATLLLLRGGPAHHMWRGEAGEAALRAAVVRSSILASELLVQAAEAHQPSAFQPLARGGVSPLAGAAVALASAVAALDQGVVWQADVCQSSEALLGRLCRFVDSAACSLPGDEDPSPAQDPSAEADVFAWGSAPLQRFAAGGAAPQPHAGAAAAAAIRLYGTRYGSVVSDCGRRGAAAGGGGGSTSLEAAAPVAACLAALLGAVGASRAASALDLLAAPLAAVGSLGWERMRALLLCPVDGGLLLGPVAWAAAALAQGLLDPAAAAPPRRSTANALAGRDATWGGVRAEGAGSALPPGAPPLWFSSSDHAALVGALQVWSCAIALAAECQCRAWRVGEDAGRPGNGCGGCACAVRPGGPLAAVAEAAEAMLRVGSGAASGVPGVSGGTVEDAGRAGLSCSGVGVGAAYGAAGSNPGAAYDRQEQLLLALTSVLSAAAEVQHCCRCGNAERAGILAVWERVRRVFDPVRAVPALPPTAGTEPLPYAAGAVLASASPRAAAGPGATGEGADRAALLAPDWQGPGAWGGPATPAAEAAGLEPPGMEPTADAADELADAEAILDECLSCVPGGWASGRQSV